MSNKYVISLFLTIALSLTGCGVDGDTCAAQVSIDLDSENFTDVVTALENNQTCSGSLTKEDAWLNLGAAYIGQAGISAGKIIGSFASMSGASGLGAIMGAFDGASTSKGLNALNKAEKTYSYLITASGKTCADAIKPPTLDAACTYTEIATTVKMIGVMNASLGGFVDLIGTTIVSGSADDVDNDGAADESEATQCAIKDADTAGTCSISGSNVAISVVAGVLFDDGQGFSQTYIPATYTIPTTTAHPAAVFYKLIDATATPHAPITTSGLCKADFTVCPTVDYGAGACYPCPVVIDGTTLSTTEGILDVVNSDTIDPNVKSAIDLNGDGTVDSAELAAAMANF